MTPGTYQNSIPNIENKEKITDIIVIGGFNDRSIQLAPLLSGINEFINYCKTNYPNAIVHVGAVGFSWNPEYLQQIGTGNNYINAYKSTADNGGKYIVNSEFVMHQFDAFTPEQSSTVAGNIQYVHPSALGAELIARCVTQDILNQPVSVQYAFNVEFENDTKVTANTTSIYEFINNDITTLQIIGGTLAFSETLPNTSMSLLCNLKNGCVVSSNQSTNSWIIPAKLDQGGGTYIDGYLYVQLAGHGLYIRPSIPTATIALSNCMLTMSSLSIGTFKV